MTEAASEREIQVFFKARLLPLGGELRKAGIGLLESGWRTDAPTYFVARRKRAMERQDFERGGLSGVERAEEEMRDAWRAADGHPLAPLAADVARLACRLRQQQAQSSELPQFIYAMY